ncbi:GNAT family N-acetyltransferase [Streptomyces sp. NPDC097981]|uniref:GNAT family N-acetyltransferase n=1 Tax=Streptomyces sp. NPDC097981 TaxID=3155428 RepID=UPI00333306F4
MFEIPSHQLPSLTSWFPSGTPGPGALVEHALSTGTGRWWVDRAIRPRALAVACGDQVLLRGDPQALAVGALTPFALSYVEAPARFGPALYSAFDRVTPWERMVYVHQAPTAIPPVRRGVTVRRLSAEDALALDSLGSDSAWIHATWGRTVNLASSGYGWAAFADGRVLALACTRFKGSAYEDIAVLTHPDRRRERLALACVTALTRDIAARGRTASWCCSRDNRPSRLLAWTAGFRLAREYVHHVTGRPVPRGIPAAVPA